MFTRCLLALALLLVYVAAQSDQPDMSVTYFADVQCNTIGGGPPVLPLFPFAFCAFASLCLHACVRVGLEIQTGLDRKSGVFETRRLLGIYDLWRFRGGRQLQRNACRSRVLRCGVLQSAIAKIRGSLACLHADQRSEFVGAMLEELTSQVNFPHSSVPPFWRLHWSQTCRGNSMCVLEC
jgi:hypothetical protein